MGLNLPALYDIACHFYVSRIPGATIPATRLSNTLDSMYRGRPLTAVSLNYLLQQNLSELHQLATGQITYAAFIAALDPALVTSEQAAKARHQVKEADRLAREAARVHKYQRERAVAEAAPIACEAKWAVQCKLNRDAAEAACKARMNDPDYVAPSPYDIARHYRVDHIPNAVTRPLSNILNALYEGRPLVEAYLEYLKIKRFSLLYELAIGQATYEAYISAVEAAEAARASAETARLEQAEAQRLRREAAEAARIARESDPAYILRKKYGIVAIDQSLLPRLMVILQSIDSGDRLAEDDYDWLDTEAKEHFTEDLRKAYHLREAEFFTTKYRRTKDPWNAVNASSHYRKCDKAEAALELLDSVPTNRVKDPKVESAMYTTRGGVMRDLNRRNEAVECGKKAHELQPKSSHPCTLLGAVHMEMGNFAEGHVWYTKAEQRGACPQSIDSELRSFFLRADKARRETMKALLLAKDPNRYRWVNDKKYLSI